MAEETKRQIQVAYEAAKKGDRPFARQILQDIVMSDRQSPDMESAWYLYARIAENREEAIYCLQKVLELNPGNERARRELEQLQGRQTSAPAAAAKSSTPAFYPESEAAPASASSTPAFYSESKAAPARSKKPPQKKIFGMSRNMLLLIGGGIIALCVVGVTLAFIIFSSFGAAPAAPAAPTITTTIEPTIPPTATLVPPTPTLSGDPACICSDVNAYLERWAARYYTMMNDRESLLQADKAGNIEKADIGAISGNANNIYKEEMAELTVPSCLQSFHSTSATVFWGWQDAVNNYVNNRNAQAIIGFINTYADTDLPLFARDVWETLPACPMPTYDSKPIFEN